MFSAGLVTKYNMFYGYQKSCMWFICQLLFQVLILQIFQLRPKSFKITFVCVYAYFSEPAGVRNRNKDPY